MLYTVYDVCDLAQLGWLSSNEYLDPYSRSVYMLPEFREYVLMNDEELWSHVERHVTEREITRMDGVLLAIALVTNKWEMIASVASQKLLLILKRASATVGMKHFMSVIRGSRLPNSDVASKVSIKDLCDNSLLYGPLLENKNFLLYLQRRERIPGSNVASFTELRTLAVGLSCPSRKSVLDIANDYLEQGDVAAVGLMVRISGIDPALLALERCRTKEIFVHVLENIVLKDGRTDAFDPFLVLISALQHKDTSRLAYLVNSYPEILTDWSADDDRELSGLTREALVAAVKMMSPIAFEMVHKHIGDRLLDPDKTIVVMAAGHTGDATMFKLVANRVKCNAHNTLQSLGHITDPDFVLSTIELFKDTPGVTHVIGGMWSVDNNPHYYSYFIYLHEKVIEIISPQPREYSNALSILIQCSDNLELMKVFYERSDKDIIVKDTVKDMTSGYVSYDPRVLAWIVNTIPSADVREILLGVAREINDDHVKIEKLMNTITQDVSDYISDMIEVAKGCRNIKTQWFLERLIDS